MTAAITAFVFPGQGSQRTGMLAALPHNEWLDALLERATTTSGLDLSTIAGAGPDSALADTRAAQPLLYLAGLGWARALEASGVHPAYVAGHSLGELTALAVAGVFSAEAGLDLVCERARIMAESAESVPGTMAAVLGMPRETVLDILEGASGVWVANDNSPLQVVITGTHEGIQWASGALLASGARRVLPLSVAGPFHSPLMADAAQAFGALVAGTPLVDASIPVIQNTVPTPATDAEMIRERLLGQMTAPVRWTETMAALTDAGVARVVECGTGSVLTGLARTVEGLKGYSVEVEGVDRIVEVIGA